MPFRRLQFTPKNAIVDLDLSAIALCNEGANSRAHILLTKRKENQTMNFDEIMKALIPEQAAVITAHIAELTKSKDDTISDLTANVATLKTNVETMQKAKTNTEEDILKAASPEIKAMVEKLQNSVSGLVAAQEEVIAKERFNLVKAIPAEEEELKSILKSASPAVFEVLKKAANAIEASLVAKGSNAGGDMSKESSADEAYNSLAKTAKTIMAETAGITFERAFTMACEKDAKVYKAYTKGVN
jgi:ABC-type transporter Mla subunit MlaD